MQSRHNTAALAAPIDGDSDIATTTELEMLRGVFRMLPAGVTVQDEQGRLLLINDAAAAQFGIAATDAARLPSSAWLHRRQAGLEVLRDGRPAVV